jgi:hypothetical protein
MRFLSLVASDVKVIVTFLEIMGGDLIPVPPQA